MSTKVSMFRSQLGGFNRDDVNNYIKETDMKYSAELESLRAEINLTKSSYETKITALTEGNAHLITELNETKEKLESYFAEESSSRDALDKAERKIVSLTAEAERTTALAESLKVEKASLAAQLEAAKSAAADNAELIDKIKNYSIALEEKDAALAVMRAEIENLTSAALEKENPEKEHKIDLYDKISSQVGDILINANRNADSILAEAESEAEKLRSDCVLECEQKQNECDTAIAKAKSEIEEEAAYVRERISETASSLLSAVSSDLHVNVENCIREITTCVADMQYEIKALLTKLSNRSGEMSDRIDYYQNCVSEGVEEKLNEMDKKYGIKKPVSDGEDQNA